MLRAIFTLQFLTGFRHMSAPYKDVKKVVLAYSGGLDTSIILKWLQTELGAEVVTFTADLGQGDELEPARKKAEMLGIKEIYIEDVREEFISDFVFPMFRANALYEGIYLLGTSIARPLISKRLVEIAEETGLTITDIEFVLSQDCIDSEEFYRPEHFILLNYTCRVTGETDVTLNEEAQAFRWVSETEALQLNLTRPTRILLDAVMARAAIPADA